MPVVFLAPRSPRLCSGKSVGRGHASVAWQRNKATLFWPVVIPAGVEPEKKRWTINQNYRVVLAGA